MKQSILLIIIAILIPAAGSSQVYALSTPDTLGAQNTVASSNGDSPQRTDRRWVYGIELGFAIDAAEWGLHLSPQIGYRVTDSFIVGGGISQTLFIGRGYWSGNRSYIAGVNGYAQLFPIRNLFVFAKPEVHYRWWRNSLGQTSDIAPFFSMPVGVGVVIPVGRGGIAISLFYDVIQNQYTPYGDSLGYSLGYVFRW